MTRRRPLGALVLILCVIAVIVVALADLSVQARIALAVDRIQRWSAELGPRGTPEFDDSPGRSGSVSHGVATGDVTSTSAVVWAHTTARRLFSSPTHQRGASSFHGGPTCAEGR